MRDAWDIALAGLQRQLAGLRQREIAEHLGVTASMVGRRLRMHNRLCRNPASATRLGPVALLCIPAAFPEQRPATHRRHV